MAAVRHLEFVVTSQYCVKEYIFMVSILSLIGFAAFEISAITLQRVSAYSVVRAICQVNGERRFLAIRNP